MFYVYVPRSEADSGFYIVYYEAYIERADALGRERYLKSGAGRRFLKAQLRHYPC